MRVLAAMMAPNSDYNRVMRPFQIMAGAEGQPQQQVVQQPPARAAGEQSPRQR